MDQIKQAGRWSGGSLHGYTHTHTHIIIHPLRGQEAADTRPDRRRGTDSEGARPGGPREKQGQTDPRGEAAPGMGSQPASQPPLPSGI